MSDDDTAVSGTALNVIVANVHDKLPEILIIVLVLLVVLVVLALLLKR